MNYFEDMYPTRGGLQIPSEINRLFPETKEQEYDILLSPTGIYNTTTPSYSKFINNSSSSQELSPDNISSRRFDYTLFGKPRLQEYAKLSKRVSIDGRILDKPEITNQHPRNAHESSDIGFEFPRRAFENSKENYDISNRIWNMETFSDTVKGIWDTGVDFETPKRMWDTDIVSETPKRMWDTEMVSEMPKRMWDTKMASETPKRMLDPEMVLEMPKRTWDTEMVSETPKRMLDPEMVSEMPKRMWNTEIVSETPKRMWNSQMVPVGNLDTCMTLESPKRKVETGIGWETPNRFWNSENGLETSRKYWDMDVETPRSYRNMKMDLDIPKMTSKTIFEILRGTVEDTKSGSNIQRKVNGDENPIFDLPQRNSNAKPAFEMPRRVSLCDSDDFSTWQPMDPVQPTRSSTPIKSSAYELFPSPINSYFSSKTLSPPTSLHRSQSQMSMNSWNSPRNFHDYSLDQSFDQNSLLNYSFSTSSVYDGPPPCLNVIKPNYICTFCRKNGETPSVYTSHVVKVKDGRRTIVTCPILRSLVCTICHQSGDNAHTITYCPELRKRNNGQPLKSTTVTLKNTRVKSNGRRRY